jgi:hypothetical protein
MGSYSTGCAQSLTFGKFFSHFGDRSAGFETMAEWRNPSPLQSLELLPAKGDQFVLCLHGQAATGRGATIRARM